MSYEIIPAKMEEVIEVAGGKCRRRLSPEHTLFAAGNALRISKYYQSIGLDVSATESDDDDDDVFVCRLFHCQGIGFRSVRAYEEHYDLVHRNVCHECGRSFLSYRLLDIHLSETHDAFFRVLAKRQPMYACLVDGCTQMFKHDDKRAKHLVAEHHYPPSFAFHRPRRHPTKPKTTLHDKDLDAIKIAKAHARKLKRREKKKQEAKERKRATDKPMDTADVPQQVEVIPDETMEESASDIGDLALRMNQLMVPRSVSFGRRQQRR